MTIKALNAIVRPPEQPVETGTKKNWRSVESALETTLPSDFQDVMLSYGSGMFTNQKSGDVIYFYNPFADHYVKFINGEHDSLREYRREEGKEDFEYAVCTCLPRQTMRGEGKKAAATPRSVSLTKLMASTV